MGATWGEERGCRDYSPPGGAAIRYLVSENRDFLKELPALPFTVLSSEEAVRLLEESGS